MNNLFGKRLKELRLEKGLTQEELSKLSGVSFPTISRYEKGKRTEPKRSMLQAKRMTEYEANKRIKAGAEFNKNFQKIKIEE